MKKPSKALVNNIQEFSFNQNSIDALDLQKRDKNTYHLIHKNKSLRVELLFSNFLKKVYSLKINSNIYEVEIKRPVDELIQKMGYASGSSKIINSIHAPMPGIILDVKIEKGTEVKEGDTLLILEAMKMENAILSPKDAVIKEVFTEVGETVDKNKLLIDFE